ncbi:DUF3325 family protein [Flavisphingomonas formosensis]|uniref:DUF3325 family protein n=1 Tax=Flavisphingomonas formosensis TaxID=861534 RepID=UPI0012FBE0A5|nr:DUF3325 family protein [Sphingomonas formosensis]
MPLETLLLGYAALANLARASGRPQRVADAIPLLRPVHAKIAGIALALLSLVASFWRFGAYQGLVAWLGLTSLAGVALVLLLSRWPVAALRLWLPAMALAVPIDLVGF